MNSCLQERITLLDDEIDTIISPVRKLRGSVTAPSDKSLCVRAAIFGALAEGTSVFEDFLIGENTIDTLDCLKALGVEYECINNQVQVEGRSGVFAESTRPLDVGTSAATLRAMAGLAATQPFLTILQGSHRTNFRPMDRVIAPLSHMGATILGRGNGRFAPLAISGGDIRGIEWKMPISSSEVKTSILIAGLFANADTTIYSPIATRDHSERMLTSMGATIRTDDDGKMVSVSPLNIALKPLHARIPGDISVAVYWIVVGCVHRDAEITVQNVGVNDLRTGLLDVLVEMGAKIKLVNQRISGGEPIADIEVRSSELHGIEIDPTTLIRMIDEVPGFALAASLAQGKTTITGAGDLRWKKSDRLGNVVSQFKRLGANVYEIEEGLIFEGVETLNGGTCSGFEDHRLANSLAVTGLVSKGPVTVQGADWVWRISYPEFLADLASLAGPDCVQIVKRDV